MAAVERPVRAWKVDLANKAVMKHGVRSFADLGACWGVHAGYSIEVIKHNQIDRAFAVDMTITDLAKERAKSYPRLFLVKGDLGSEQTLASIPHVDALIMFDLLLHQAAPDWDEFLEMWSRKARVLIIFNQMWKRGDRSLRFVDHGRDWYKENVYYRKDDKIDRWFDRHDEVDLKTGRRVKDLPHYWQWGITKEDLQGKAESLGFGMEFFQNYGPFKRKKTPWIQNEGFIFVRNS
jgi:hypothetical protein